MNPTLRTLLIAVIALNAVGLAQATELGINYYHESMMSDKWKVPYINDLTLEQADKDFDDINNIARHVKLYMNPFVDGNDQWVAQLSQRAKNHGLNVVVNMMTDDRNLEPWNWDSYAQKVRDDCSYLSGKVDEILVGNEIILHSSMSKYEVRDRVEKLISECQARFDGEVSYEAFWYEKEAWYDYSGKLYFMQYESVSSFTTNVKEMAQRFGSNGLVGEFGEDLYDEGTYRDDWWQKESMEARWNEMEKAGVPVAYLFAYREPSWNGFGLIRPDGIKRPMYAFFDSLGQGTSSTYTPPTYQEPTKPQPEPEEEQSWEPTNKLSELSAQCVSDAGCWEKTDEMKGTCREVRFGTNRGDIKVLACEKLGGNLEVYAQSAPNNLNYKACVGAGCVEDDDGFARVSIDASQPNLGDQQQEQEQQRSSSTSLSQLSTSCSASNTHCDVTVDRMEGTCRDVTFNTGWGDIKTKACEKDGDKIEVYLLARPVGLDFEACIGSACVRDEQGFAKTYLSSSSEQPKTSSGANGVEGLQVSCESGNSHCNLVHDATNGACREVHFSTGKGTLKTMACEKGGDQVEIYVGERPSGLDFKVCYDGACVRDEQGFTKFALSGSNQESSAVASKVSELSVSATPNANKKGDWTSGTCRTVQYDTSKGWIEAQACDKGDHYEIYLKTQGAQANLCFEQACVTDNQGFARLNK